MLNINKTRKTRGGLIIRCIFCSQVDGPVTGGLISSSLWVYTPPFQSYTSEKAGYTGEEQNLEQLNDVDMQKSSSK